MEEINELYAKLETNNAEKLEFYKRQKFEEGAALRDTETPIIEGITLKIAELKTKGKGFKLYLDKGLSRQDGLTIRSFERFVYFLENFELPDSIFFNDELGDKKSESDNSTYDCARFLVLHCIENKLPLPNFNVNILPPQKINLLLNNFLNRN